MIKKFKVNELAKSFGVTGKDVLTMLEERFPNSGIKSVSVMTQEQMDYVVSVMLEKSKVDTFDEYFNMEVPDDVLKMREAEQFSEEMAVRKAKQEALMAERARKQTEEREKQKSAPYRAKTERRTVAQSQQAQPTVEAQQAPQTATEQKSIQGGQGAGEIFAENSHTKEAAPVRKDTQEETVSAHSTAQPKTQQRPNGAARDARTNRQDRQGRQNSTQRTSQPAPRPVVDDKPIEIRVQQPKKKQKREEAVAKKPSEMVVVDMRASEVNLDKYNERYETIAPAPAMRDSVITKQKLTQRSARRAKPLKSRKEREEDKLHRLELERQRRQKLEVFLPEELSVGDLAGLLKVQASELIKRLMGLGVMASVSDIIDFDTASLVAMEIGAKVEREVKLTIEERLFEQELEEENREPRPPIVVVMGHVDHGKTSLLDAIRNGNVAEGEAGGITQHIGAYQVGVNGRLVTFLDTPGHEAFTSMRARGAQVTDIAVLVVAADDGIMPQTVEAINHAKAAGVTIIVAINKIDKPEANPDRVLQQLTEHELIPEDWGGDTICVPVSAKRRIGIENLLEMIQLVADMKELRANSNRSARGTVIEAKLDKGRGPIATVLIQNGTLKTGDAIIAGTAVGRVRVMMSDRGKKLDTAGPSTPVEITGLTDVPGAGDMFNAVEDERLARELVEQRKAQAKEEIFKSFQKVTLDNLFEQISVGEMKELPIIIKGDVQGSVEAVKQSLEKLTNEEVRVKVIHGAVGAVSESDVMLAEASGAIIVGFNVRPDPIAKESAEHTGVDIRLYRVIYDAIDEVQSAMKGMLTPKFRDVELGRSEVREVYNITGVGKVAGSYVLNGKINRGANVRVVRDGIIIADDKLQTLRRFKDDVKEVADGYECGVTLAKFTDIKVGDIFEVYEVEQIEN